MRPFFRIPFVRTPEQKLIREVSDELQFHVDTRTDQLISAGWKADDAMREALRQFGSVESVRDDCVALDIERERTNGWRDFTSDVRQDVRYALRALRRTPGWTSVAVITLALGIGANTAAFAVVSGVLLRPLPFPNSERLMLISNDERQPAFNVPSMIDSHYLMFRKANRSFEGVAAFTHFGEVNLIGAGDAVRVGIANVTPEFFSVLGVRPEIGRIFALDEGSPGRNHVVVISDRLWRGAFGADPNVLKRIVRLEEDPFQIIGVMPAAFDFPIGRDLWIPTEIVPHEGFVGMMPVVGRLKNDVHESQAQAELSAMARSLAVPPVLGKLGLKRSDYVPLVVPLRELMVHDAEHTIITFAAAIAFVLLIACVNVASLLLMRTTSRAQEISVRRSLGAGRGRLIRQLMTESTVLALAGAAVGMAFAVAGERALLLLAPAGTIPLADNIRLDWRVFSFVLAVSLLSGSAFGLAPALRATRRSPRESLNHGTRVTSEGRFLLNALAVAEVALALILLTAAGLMIRSVLRLQEVKLGFDPQFVTTLTLDPVRERYNSESKLRNMRDEFLEQVVRLRSTRAAGAVNWLPLGGESDSWRFTAEGSATEVPNVITAGVAGDYFGAMRIPVISGRIFTIDDDSNAPPVVMVSQSIARKAWPNENAVGKRISIPDFPAPPQFLKKRGGEGNGGTAVSSGPKPELWLTVVGVVSDVVQDGLKQGRVGAIYIPLDQMGRTLTFHPEQLGPYGRISFVVRSTAESAQLEQAMRDALRRVDSDQPVKSIASMSVIVGRQREQLLFWTRLLTSFSVIALALAVVGVYGVLAFSVAERTREIGIRMALGATPGQVVRSVTARSLLIGVLGVAIGAAGSFTTTRLITGFLFGISATDPSTIVGCAVLLAVITLVAGVIPARRASSVDPIISLRLE